MQSLRDFGLMRLLRGPGPLAAAILALSALAGCQTEEPPPAENFLRIQLNDSLARYDRVTVMLVDRVDTTRMLDTLWDGPLRAPSKDIPDYNMKYLGRSEFIIKITAFRAGRLAVQTRIFYSPENQVVRHDSVPPLVAQNWLISLKPDTGTMSPEFDKDSLSYLVKLPQGVHSVSFIPIAPIPQVSIQARGLLIPSGSRSKTYQVGDSAEKVTFMVTDTATGTASTRNYEVVIVPAPPVGVYLDTLEPSTGFLGQAFTPENPAYYLYMPADKDTVSFRVSSRDPGTMSITVDGTFVSSGAYSRPPIFVAKGSVYTVPIRVTRGNQVGYYQVTLDHRGTASH